MKIAPPRNEELVAPLLLMNLSKFQVIEKSKASVAEVVLCFATVKTKDSRETIRCIYQAKLKQH